MKIERRYACEALVAVSGLLRKSCNKMVVPMLGWYMM
jgi:hypothetical protein